MFKPLQLSSITSGKVEDDNPAWSPDGKRIVFNTNAANGRDTRIPVVGTEHKPASSAGAPPLRTRQLGIHKLH